MGYALLPEPDVSVIQAVEPDTQKDAGDSKVESCKASKKIPVVEVMGEESVKVDSDIEVVGRDKIEMDAEEIESCDDESGQKLEDGVQVKDVKEVGARAVGQVSVIDLTEVEGLDESKVEKTGNTREAVNTVVVLDDSREVEEKVEKIEENVMEEESGETTLTKDDDHVDLMAFEEEIKAKKEEEVVGIENLSKTVEQGKEEANTMTPLGNTIPAITVSQPDTSTPIHLEMDSTSVPGPEVQVNGIEPETTTHD